MLAGLQSDASGRYGSSCQFRGMALKPLRHWLIDFDWEFPYPPGNRYVALSIAGSTLACVAADLLALSPTSSTA
ncbi:MAG: hypothetical protein U0892_05060 [Pirellulales bacterium]